MWPDVEMKQIPYLNNHNNLTRAPLIINRRAFFLLRMNVPLAVSVLKLTDVRQTLKHLWWRRGQSRGNIRICGRNVPHTFFKQWNGKRVKASSSLCSKVSRLATVLCYVNGSCHETWCGDTWGGWSRLPAQMSRLKQWGWRQDDEVTTSSDMILLPE